MKEIMETLQKEKMENVQILATYYQQSIELPPGEKRDEVIRNILDCKHQIKLINDKLTEMKKQGLK